MMAKKLIAADFRVADMFPPELDLPALEAKDDESGDEDGDDFSGVESASALVLPEDKDEGDGPGEPGDAHTADGPGPAVSVIAEEGVPKAIIEFAEIVKMLWVPAGKLNSGYKHDTASLGGVLVPGEGGLAEVTEVFEDMTIDMTIEDSE